MSHAILPSTGQLRWWNEAELDYRNDVVRHLRSTIQTSLTEMNRAWVFERIEGPMLVPRSMVAPGYTEDDLWTVKAGIGDETATMRPETTSSSYMAARRILGSHRKIRMPLCVWQVGKSFRREISDGANAAKLRFFEFTQLEFQCIYAEGTMADYRGAVMPGLEKTLGWLTGAETRVITQPASRTPGYSTRTDDVEVLKSMGEGKTRWTEMSSVSTRTDFEGAIVLEIAIGVDRVVEIAGENGIIRGG